MALPAITSYVHPSNTNVWVPNYDESARIIVQYARDPKKFAVNNYVTVSTIEKPIGIYPKILASDNIRVTDASMRDMAWPDGQVRPGWNTAQWDTGRFTNQQYFAQRYSKTTTIGYWTLENAGWDIKTQERNSLAARIMTARTKMTIDTLFNTTDNFPATNYSTPVALGAGFWGSGTINDPYIQETLSVVRDQIILGTNATVDIDSLCLVINPTTAGVMARSQEIRAYLAQQAGSLDVLSGKNPNMLNAWGLPNELYGFKVIVDATPIVLGVENSLSSNPQPTYLFPDNKAAIVARPGSVTGDAGGVAFSTIHILELKGEAMALVENMDDVHKLMNISISDYFTPYVVAPETGYILTSLLS